MAIETFIKSKKEIESILEEDLKDVYFSLDVALRKDFKSRGEDSVKRIIELLKNPKIKRENILKIIEDWLSILKLNRFFSVQEAKIKTDKILGPDRIITRIILSKDLSEENQKKEPRELILPMETIYANLSGLNLKKNDYFTFEIVADQENLITFYVTCPAYLQKFVKDQIQAQFPEAQLEEIDDYNTFISQGAVSGAALFLEKNSIFPIKTYIKIGKDPINGLISTFSKFKGQEKGVIQILAKPAPDKWSKMTKEIITKIKQGKTINQALDEVSGNKFFKFFKDFFGAAKSESKMEKNLAASEKESYGSTPLEQELIKDLEDEASKACFEVSVRVVVSNKDEKLAQRDLDDLISSFSQYNIFEYGNKFKSVIPKNQDRLLRNFIFRNFSSDKISILNTEELTSIFHIPLPTLEAPNIRWLLAKRVAPPIALPEEGLLLGKNIYQGMETLVKIKKDDRQRHVYIIGMTGTGKSVLIANMAVQDIKNGEGVCVIDPHGDLIEDILQRIPEERLDDAIIFDPSDTERPIGLNMLEAKTSEEGDFAVQEMIAIWQKMFPPEILGPVFEHNMRNNLLTLMSDMENPGTLIEIPKLFTDPDFQKLKLEKVKNPQVRLYWEKEIAKTSDFHKSEMYGYIISKVGRFAENEMIRNIIGQHKSGFNFREIMDKKKILLVNLSKGKVGEVNSNLLGLIIVAKLQMNALSRADLPLEQRNNFYLYIDEFQNFITKSISTILSEARKYRLNLIIANQYLGQLLQGQNAEIKDAVLGTVGTMIAFKTGVEDAAVLAKEFKPVFSEYDLINIEKFNACVKLLVDNQPSRAFNMQTFNLEPGDKNISQKIKEMSRLKYGRDKAVVEKEILERLNFKIK